MKRLKNYFYPVLFVFLAQAAMTQQGGLATLSGKISTQGNYTAQNCCDLFAETGYSTSANTEGYYTFTILPEEYTLKKTMRTL